MFIVLKYDLHLQFHDLNYFHMVLVNRKNLFIKKKGITIVSLGGQQNEQIQVFFFIHLNKREETCCWPRLDQSERNSGPARYLPKSSRVEFSFFVDMSCCSGLVLQLSGLGYSLPSSCFSLPQSLQPNLSLGLKCSGRDDRQVQATISLSASLY